MAKDDALQWDRFTKSVAEELHFILWELECSEDADHHAWRIAREGKTADDV